MHSRRSRLRRVVLWPAAAVLLLAAYALSPPFLSYWVTRYAPPAMPVLRALWSPLELYARHPAWPGSRAYVEYEMWANRRLQDHFASDADVKLNEMTQIQFNGTPLSDVASYLSALHDHRIELLEGIDGDIPVTMNANGKLRDALDQLVQPLGLAAAPVGTKIVIGPPAEVERLVVEADAAASSGRWIADLVVLANLVLIVAVIVLLLRRRSARQRVAFAASSGPIEECPVPGP